MTVIDQNDYFEHIFTNIKSSVDADFPEKVLHSFDKIAKAYPKLNFKQGKLVNVNRDDTIVIETHTGLRSVVDFDVLVLCTGFSYNSPIKSESALTLNDRKKSL